MNIVKAATLVLALGAGALLAACNRDAGSGAPAGSNTPPAATTTVPATPMPPASAASQ